MYDVIIIGKGPAGLSSALYLGRAGYKTLVIGMESALEKTKKIDNFLGIESFSGVDYIRNAEEQVKKVGVEIEVGKVLKVSEIENENERKFSVVTETNEYESKSLIIAIGSKKSKNEVKSEEKYLGKGVSYCVACDGFFYRNKTVGVLGHTEHVVLKALELKDYTPNVTIFTNGNELIVNDRYNDNLKEFKIEMNKIEDIYGDERLKYLVLDGGKKIDLDGLFIANETPDVTDFASYLGIYVKDGKIVVDENSKTNMEGVFACGDIVNSFMQLSTAIGGGANASKSCIKYLIQLKMKNKK